MAGLQCYAIKNKIRNHSVNEVKKRGYEIYKQPGQDLGLCRFSLARYSVRCFAQIYKALYGVAMFVSLAGTVTWRL